MIVFGAPVIRRYELLSELMKSLKTNSLQPDGVIIVDNGGKLPEHQIDFPTNSTFVYPEKNIGVAGAWNTILDKASPGDYVIISNDDIRLMSHSLKAIVDGLKEHPLVCAHGFALFGMRRSLVDQIGWFDENFFPAYFEDNDYVRRLRLAGMEIHEVAAGAAHVGSASLHCLPQEEQDAFSEVFAKIRSYYVRKWGRRPEKGECFSKPFNGKVPTGWRERSVTR